MTCPRVEPAVMVSAGAAPSSNQGACRDDARRPSGKGVVRGQLAVRAPTAGRNSVLSSPGSGATVGRLCLWRTRGASMLMGTRGEDMKYLMLDRREAEAFL